MKRPKNVSPIKPHGGTLVNLVASLERQQILRKESWNFPSWNLTERQLCDLELLLNGAFSPLKGFMTLADYTSTIKKMRLSTGELWPIPIVLDVPEDFAKSLKGKSFLALRNGAGTLLAVLHIEDIWVPAKEEEAQAVYGTKDPFHTGVGYLFSKTHSTYIGGKIEGLGLPEYFDFADLRMTPEKLRQEFIRKGWHQIAAFQTRNPIHRAHFEMTWNVVKEMDLNLLLHPAVGVTQAGDVDVYTRIRCYLAILPYYPKDLVKLALLPIAMRMAGPKEALWHAIIRMNYGCTHLIVGRNHASPINKEGGEFYAPAAAQEMLANYTKELGIKMIPFEEFSYVPELRKFLPKSKIGSMHTLSISGTQLREKLVSGKAFPTWFTFPEVIQELHHRYPLRKHQGLTLFFTGLSAAGKSTISQLLSTRLLELGQGKRESTLLDGDSVRHHLSSELGFSKEHRNLNILRLGFVASLITKHRGIAICAPIAPYDSVRKEVRSLISSHGGFILIYLSTALEVCEGRDKKGLYAKARLGVVKQFTGISDPYEVPEDAEIVIDTSIMEPEACVWEIINYLKKHEYL